MIHRSEYVVRDPTARIFSELSSVELISKTRMIMQLSKSKSFSLLFKSYSSLFMSETAMRRRRPAALSERVARSEQLTASQ